MRLKYFLFVNIFFLISTLLGCATQEIGPCENGKKFCVTDWGGIRASDENKGAGVNGVLHSSGELRELLGNPKEAQEILTQYEYLKSQEKFFYWTSNGLIAIPWAFSFDTGSLPLFVFPLYAAFPLQWIGTGVIGEDQQTLALQAMNLANGDPKNTGLELRTGYRSNWALNLNGGFEISTLYSNSGIGTASRLGAGVEYYFGGRHGILLEGAALGSTSKFFEFRMGYSNQSFLVIGKQDRKFISGIGFLNKKQRNTSGTRQSYSGIFFNSDFGLFDFGPHFDLRLSSEFQFVNPDLPSFGIPQFYPEAVVGLGLKIRFQ
jgi:hypothetical protein